MCSRSKPWDTLFPVSAPTHLPAASWATDKGRRPRRGPAGAAANAAPPSTTANLVSTASAPPPAQAPGSREGDSTRSRDAGASSNQSGQPRLRWLRNLVVSGRLREPRCLPCVYLAPLRGWKLDLRGDRALDSPWRELWPLRATHRLRCRQGKPRPGSKKRRA